MISSLKRSLKIDISYAVNSFIYVLRKLPIFSDLITDDIYKSKTLKCIISIISILLSFGRMLIGKIIYFFVIYYICTFLFDSVDNFVHIYFIFTIIGLFLNNKLLNASQKKYLSILVFNMDARNFMWNSLGWDLFINLVLNIISFSVFTPIVSFSYSTIILLLIISLFSRVIGEAFCIWFYKKYKYIWYTNYTMYFSILGILLGLCLLPYVGIVVNNSCLIISSIVLGILCLISLIYLIGVKDYKIMFKRLNSLKQAMNEEEKKAYARQSMVEIKNKDKDVDIRKIKGKKGFDLFNTLFYERHKAILENSAKKYSLVILGLYIVAIIFVISNSRFNLSINNFFMNRLGMFVLIMYFINRGSVVTQAMFYNCDHAMLNYNFYREPKVLLGLFKKRLISIIKINLMPAFIIGTGNCILIYLTGGASAINYITSFLFIVLFSIFFSVHYLVLYYLLQPFNKSMQMKKISYGLASFLTYYFSYIIFYNLVVSSLVLSVISIIFVIIYVFLALFLVYKFAPRTFKISN